MLGIVGVLDLPDEVFSRPGFAERVVSVGEPWLGEAPPGPNRAELVEMMSSPA
jgi:hypothetical protein